MLESIKQKEDGMEQEKRKFAFKNKGLKKFYDIRFRLKKDLSLFTSGQKKTRTP